MTTTSPTLTDDELAFARAHLFTAVVGDVMDVMGLTQQFLPPAIRPIRNDMRLLGRAMTVVETDLVASDPQPTFGRMFEALDDLKAGEIYICTGSSPTYALWGEMMTVRAQRLGAGGAVLDGYSRDTNGLLNLDFPVFSHGFYAQDQGVRGYVPDFRQKLAFPNGTMVNDGDFVFGDIDGVVVIPRAAEREVFAKAAEKVLGENTVRKSLESGMSAQQAFSKYGIM